MLDPGMFQSEAGRREAKEVASRYYRLLHDSIRRYDPHHLILGDRYEANAPLPLEVVEAARPWVDVLSFQDFKAPVEQLRRWHESTGMPVLWADGAKGIPAEGGWLRNDGAWWAAQLAGLRENPGCVGAHLCGAYLRNGARRRGLRDELERPDEQNIARIREANQQTAAWVAEWQARL
jgi:hypothetical protein